MKETKGRRRKRVFSGMNIADLRLLKEHKALPRGMKAEELDAEIKRREVIADKMKGQDRVRGRFAGKSKTHPLKERLKVEPANPVGHRRITGLGEHVKSMIRQIVREEIRAVKQEGEANTPVAALEMAELIQSFTKTGRAVLSRLAAQETSKVSGSEIIGPLQEDGLLRRLKRWLL